jgi:nucleoside 2-deoxyribosyltransferase
VSGFQPNEKNPNIMGKEPTIYLAAPFFDIGEFWLMEEVRDILIEEGADVISPYHDIGRAEDFDDPTEMAEEDIEAIEDADGVLALIDKCDPGTNFELGYARKSDKPAVAYKHEPKRSHTSMLEGAGCPVYSDLSTAIFKIMWASR